MNAINHPSYNTSIGCTSHDCDVAIGRSLVLGGESVGITYSKGAESYLRECSEWESDKTYSFAGTSEDGREWHVHLVG